MTATAHILVIDDSSTLRKLVEIAFRGSPTTVAFAASGAEGIERAVAEPPDVILLDFILPDMRGVEVCQRLLRYPSTSHVPIVVMSGNKDGIVELFRDLPQVVDFVPKPFTTEEIGRRLRTAMRGGGSANPLDAATRFRRSSLAPPATAPKPTLTLVADLATVSLVDILRLVQSARSSGSVHLATEHGTYVIHLAGGEVVACTATGGDETDQLVELRAVDEREAAKARAEQQASGKPILVGLAESGLVRSADVPALLRASSKRLLTRALALHAGRVEWRGTATAPSWVEVFGRPVSVVSLMLEQARSAKADATSPTLAFLDEVYERTPQFSRAIAGARLNAKEQAVLRLIDGTLGARAVLDRASLSYERGAALISRLRTAGLIQLCEHTTGVALDAARPSSIAVLDSDREGFVAPLRSHLRRRPQPVDAIDLTDEPDLEGALGRHRPQLVLVSEATVDARLFATRLGGFTRAGAMSLVAVLDAPGPIDEFLRSGYDAVLIKPIHIAEIERLLSY